MEWLVVAFAMQIKVNETIWVQPRRSASFDRPIDRLDLRNYFLFVENRVRTEIRTMKIQLNKTHMIDAKP